MVIYDIIFRAFSSCCFIITAHRIVLITIFFFSLAQQYPLNAPQTRPPRRRRLVGAQWRCVTIRFCRSSLLTFLCAVCARQVTLSAGSHSGTTQT